MTRIIRYALAFTLIAAPLGAQGASSAADRLREVLPADVATRVLDHIADARSHGLPASALEQRALKFATRGAAPDAIARAIDEQIQRMAQVKATLTDARHEAPAPDEISSGAEALRQGVDGATISALASGAPSGRSLAVPLLVLGSLVGRGLPASQALAAVQTRLTAHASDADLAALAREAQHGAAAGDPADIGREMAGARRPGSPRGVAGAPGGGVPAGVPGNAGAGGRPTRPVTPPGHPPTA